MPQNFDLELIALGPEQLRILPISTHVNKYTEHFVYIPRIPDSSTPIAYFETPPLDAAKNIQIVDQTYAIPANSLELMAAEGVWTKISGFGFTTKYRDVLVTDVTYIDEDARLAPLFWKHQLPAGTKEAHVFVIENGNRIDIERGLTIKIDEDIIYTNYKNFYNRHTGAYRIHYVTSVDGDGNGSVELLNPVPAIHEASWRDVDVDPDSPNFGLIVNKTWTREDNNDGYHFTLNEGVVPGPGVFYFKVLKSSCIKPLIPAGQTQYDPWHLMFSNGNFVALVKNFEEDGNEVQVLRRYWIPEYKQQNFADYPFIFSPYRKMHWVNSNTLKATRDDLGVEPTAGRHIDLLVFDEDEVLKRVYTTDKGKHDKRFSDTKIFYESDKIISWDNQGGFVALSVEIEPSDIFYANYFYESKEYEYKLFSFNPIQNRRAINTRYVFYMIPEADPRGQEKAIHYLEVDEDGIITACSQDWRMVTQPNLQLTDRFGNYNEDTVIGMKYESMVEENNFKNKFTVPYKNNYSYYVLAEVIAMDIGDEQDATIFDVRRDGNTIKDAQFEEAIRGNPRILQSVIGHGEDGQFVPNNNVLLFRPPVTLLEDFGGDLAIPEAENLLKRYLPAANTGLIHWHYLAPIITGDSTTEGVVDLTMTWEGPNLTYNLYRKIHKPKEFELLVQIVNPAEGEVLYKDENDLIPGKTYYYSVRIVENGIELPFSDTFAIEVRDDS